MFHWKALKKKLLSFDEIDVIIYILVCYDSQQGNEHPEANEELQHLKMLKL